MGFDEHQHIAFDGEQFRIEWYVDATGHSQPLEFAEEMAKEYVAKFAQLLKVMGEVGMIRNTTKFRYEGDKIYAFKPQPYRFLCFFTEGRRLIITNGFYKKTDKLPDSEKKRALESREDYLKRVQTGDYYE